MKQNTAILMRRVRGKSNRLTTIVVHSHETTTNIAHPRIKIMLSREQQDRRDKSQIDRPYSRQISSRVVPPKSTTQTAPVSNADVRQSHHSHRLSIQSASYTRARYPATGKGMTHG